MFKYAKSYVQDTIHGEYFNITNMQTRKRCDIIPKQYVTDVATALLFYCQEYGEENVYYFLSSYYNGKSLEELLTKLEVEE